MWRTMFKLVKTFSDAAAPRRVAESIKAKIDKFKANLPLLACVCNPGLRERHWNEVRIFLVKSVQLFIILYLQICEMRPRRISSLALCILQCRVSIYSKNINVDEVGENPTPINYLGGVDVPFYDLAHLTQFG